jgi:penicillin-insensitive murein endopeptidase
MNATILATALAFVLPVAVSAQSVCFGITSNGRLEGGVQLPQRGPNFETFSTAAAMAGRTYVHSTVHDIVIDAYRQLESAVPGKRFVYGDTGWSTGGRFKPHRTHQNGLSVDFMVPVLDEKGHSIPLPRSALNRFGYDMEFDAAGRLGAVRIDFDAIAEHVHQLDIAARKRGVAIERVILDPQYLPKVWVAPRGEELRRRVRFVDKPVWWRHDEHYHVDFAVPCKALAAGK